MKAVLFILAAAVAGSGPADHPAGTPPARKMDEGARPDRARGHDLRAEMARLSARITKLSATLSDVTERIARAQRVVPTPEEFRRQVAEARQKIEKMRAEANVWWKEAGRIAEANQVKLDSRSLRNVVPEALAEDAKFLQARDKAAAQAKLIGELEERLIKAMLTTTFGDPAPATKPPPDAQAIAREWENLAANQKSLGAAVENARRKAAAAKVEFNAAELFEPASTTVQKIDSAFLKAREQVRARLVSRDGTAESVATLEFLKAVGPRYKNW